MPTVPLYGAPNVDRAPAPNARLNVQASPDAFGAAVGEGVQNLAGSVRRVQEQANQIQVADAEVQLANARNKLLTDPNEGLLNKRGKDVFKAQETVYDGFDKAAADIADNLGNPEARAQFERVAAARRVEFANTVNQHVAGEAHAYDSTVFQSTLAMSQDDAATNYRDPARVDTEVARQHDAILGYAERNGMPTEWVQQQAAAAQSKTYSTAVSRYLDAGDDLAAATYYGQVKDRIAGTDAGPLEKALDIGSLQGESQRQSDAILLKNDTETDALKAAETITDPKVRDATVQRVQQHFAMYRNAQVETQRQNFQTATDALVVAKGDLSQIPPTTMAALAPTQQIELRSYAKQLLTGDPVVDDPALYSAFKIGLANPATRAAWLKEDPNAYPSKLSPTTRKELTDFKAELLKGNDSLAIGTMTEEQAKDQALKNGGLDPASERARPDNDPTTPNIYSAIDREVIAVQKATGKKLTPDEIEKIGTALVVKRAYTTPRSILNPARWFGSAVDTNDQRAPYSITAAQVPADFREKVQASYNARRQTASDQDVLDAYLESISQQALNGP